MRARATRRAAGVLLLANRLVTQGESGIRAPDPSGSARDGVGLTSCMPRAWTLCLEQEADPPQLACEVVGVTCVQRRGIAAAEEAIEDGDPSHGGRGIPHEAGDRASG